MSDPINQDGTAADPLSGLTFYEYAKGESPPVAAPSPMSDAYAVQVADVAPVRCGPWQKAGEWKWREFGREVQLRNTRLPHLTLDLFRAEAEQLLVALAVVVGEPMKLPYRVPWHERARQWWLRAVWRRKHHVEQAEARQALIKEFTERSPWG